jgi:hypothetical protein
MSADAGLDIDFDADLAVIQGQAADLEPQEKAAVAVAGKIITSERTVELLGRRFRIADRVGLMPLLKFSAFADVSTSDPRALGAMYAMLKDCIHPGTPACGECAACQPERCGQCRGCERVRDADADPDASPCLVNTPDESQCKSFDPGDWRAFEDHACEAKADADDLLDFLSKTIELISGRPTQPPPTSSPGRRSTRDASMARSSARRGTGSKR